MNTLFLGFVIFLLILAVFDIVVGVSNDAVNFLNSAVGAKIAPLKTILVVASIGILLGASMSNGMIEIARNGIFRPAMFSFMDIMFILLAVMVADIILLDVFNSIGLPTSTTVSMVFELLGGTFALALMRNIADPSISIGDLMNTSKALEVIIAIFTSVAIAFTVGAIIQVVSRLFFTFAYKKNLKYKIGVFGGLATTCILYFLLFKGISNFSFVSKDFIANMQNNIYMVILICFIVSSIVMQGLYFLKVNVFKILVLMGTFALAMAFAGNDLVNFIGVPLAGLSSYTDFIANGNGNPATYMMTSLEGSANTPIYFLVIAGVIMIISLATSKKARKVIQTSVDLARQGEGEEMFGSSKIARKIVRSTTNFANSIADLIPEGLQKKIDKRFSRDVVDMQQGAAFDEVRATINLVVASLLIALGTSLKLPLSTTYVTFMVAMGTSLADRAWGRESAVFRITGVMSVIAGWFITAGAAFIFCFIVAMIMKLGGPYVTIGVVCIGIILLIRNNIRYRKKNKEEQGDKLYDQILASTDKQQTYILLSKHIARTQANFLLFVNKAYKSLTDGFILDELSHLEVADDMIRNERVWLKNTRRKEINGLRLIDHNTAIEQNTWFHLIVNSCEDTLFCLRRICDSCIEHIGNTFVPLNEDKIKEFTPLRDTVLFLTKRIYDVIESGNYDELANVYNECDKFEAYLKQVREDQMTRIQSTKENITMSYLYLNVIQESQELVTALRHLVRAVKHFREGAKISVDKVVLKQQSNIESI